MARVPRPPPTSGLRPTWTHHTTRPFPGTTPRLDPPCDSNVTRPRHAARQPSPHTPSVQATSYLFLLVSPGTPKFSLSVLPVLSSYADIVNSLYCLPMSRWRRLYYTTKCANIKLSHTHTHTHDDRIMLSGGKGVLVCFFCLLVGAWLERRALDETTHCIYSTK